MRAQIAARKAEILAFLRRQSSTNQVPAPPIRPRATSGQPAALSFAQERLWFLGQLEPQSTAYNICRASRVSGNLSSRLLKASVQEIVSRHETLRTTFRLIDGKPVQVVRPAEGISIDFVDLRSVEESERAATIQRQIETEALRPFDLESGTLLRCVLLRLGEQEHIIVLTTHHSAADAWSMGTLTRELWTLYDAFSNGRPSSLGPLPVQYSDYAVWQREWLQGDVLESQLGYWKERLKDLPVLNLPTDRLRKPRQRFEGAWVAIELPDQLTRGVEEMSHPLAVTPFMILLAAFQVLLYRYTGQEDVVVGSPIANRRRPELEGLIGFFVNTLVLRADLSGNPSFTELLFRVRDICVGANANQDLPFEKLVQELQPERDPSRNPLFQVMFVLQNATRPFAGIPGLRIEALEVATSRSPFDLSLFLREREGKYVGHIGYSTDLFDHERIERMAGHFRTLLEAIVKDSEQPIARLPILTEGERDRILVEWNDTAADYPKDKCIHQLFEEQVERTPEATAVEFEDQQVTYRELNRRANQLAHYLIDLGIGPEKLVGICVERSIEMVVGLLGILKAGAAYVPLDPAYPKARSEFMLQEPQCPVLITQEKWLDDQFDFDGSHESLSEVKIVCLDRDFDEISKQLGQNTLQYLSSNNLAYMIYTSGSTGAPKGVAIEHRNAVALLSWGKKVFTGDELSAVLASTSICFDLSVFELFVPLSWGGKVVLVENALRLPKRPDTKRITLINTVPSLVTALLRTGQLPDSVRVVNLAGEPLPAQLVEELYKTATVEKVYDLYGPSETTTYSTFTLRTTDSTATIGRPISNTQIYILDSNSQPVPIGVPGEIHIGGSGVARGYLGRTELTKEKFIKNPFSDDLDSRLYRTGDLGRYLPDGQIQFHGRADNQVKIRGYRIELGEIESVLNQHPDIKESVVVVREDTKEFVLELPESNLERRSRQVERSNFEKRLVAYIVARQQLAPTTSELHSFLAQHLPAYMIPAAFVRLDDVPLNNNGKLDRSKLPSPDESNRHLDELVIAPRTEIEELIANLWRDVLKLDSINVHDNFFELGGHSLLAIQIIARISDALDREVSLKTLFNAPTINGLAKALENILPGSAGERLPPIVPVPRDQPLPLSLNQEHLWHLDQMIPGTQFFNMPYVYHLSGSLDVEALDRALAEIVRRHECLRTVFREIKGQPVQITKEGADIRLKIADLRNFAVGERGEEAASLILQERKQPFDVTKGPLFRTKLVRLTDEDDLLLVTMHHIIADEWSMQVFQAELLMLYEIYCQGCSSPLLTPGLQAADCAYWERRALELGLLNEQLSYWKGLLTTVPKLQFSRRRSQKRHPYSVARYQRIELDKDLLPITKAIALRENCTPYVVVLATTFALIYLYTGQRHIRIGTQVANRSRPVTNRMMGHFTNTVIVSAQIDPEMTLNDLLGLVRATFLSAYSRQELPFEYLIRELRKENVWPDTFFQVLLMYRTQSAAVSLPGLTFAPLDIRQLGAGGSPIISTLDLVFDVTETPTMFTGAINYAVDTIDEDQAGRLAVCFPPVIRALATNRDLEINRLAQGLGSTLSNLA